jgi:hypothetical protein
VQSEHPPSSVRHLDTARRRSRCSAPARGCCPASDAHAAAASPRRRFRARLCCAWSRIASQSAAPAAQCHRRHFAHAATASPARSLSGDSTDRLETGPHRPALRAGRDWSLRRCVRPPISVLRPPTRSNSRSCSSRSSLPCRLPLRSPISSRNSVPPCGQLGFAEDPLLGPGERAALVTKQLGLHQSFGNRGAVDLHERSPSPLRVVVDGASGQLFAGTRLATNQHRRCRRCGASDDLVDPLHRRRSADDAVIALGGLHRDPLRQLRLVQRRRYFVGQLA